MSASWRSVSTARTSRQMLSASAGSFNSRYRSALAIALGIAAFVSCLSWNISHALFAGEGAPHHDHRIVVVVDDAFFERDDGIVGDVDILRADFSAALRDVAEPDAEAIFEQLRAIEIVRGVHLEARH